MEWYFTAPLEQIPVRRGDPLGFRATSDYFAELLAPGLSNATSDARWISLLSWCLQWSHLAWTKAGGGDLSRRDDQRSRYAWLRPLELLWVARTLESGQMTGQLRGRRSVKRWLDTKKRVPNFAMSSEQFRRYRQIGTYGAYRVIFRTVPNLTSGDGWTPTGIALHLAEIVNRSLPKESRMDHSLFDKSTKWKHWINHEANYWIRHGWSNAFDKTGYGYFPTPDAEIGCQLPESERACLEEVLFDRQSTRRLTAEILASAKNANSHIDLCESIAGSDKLSKYVDPVSIEFLPQFSRFADSSMHAMRGLWNELNRDALVQSPSIKHLSALSELRLRLDKCRQEGENWLLCKKNKNLPQQNAISNLAMAMKNASNPEDQIRALSEHHHEYGGSRRWFLQDHDRIIPLVANTGIAASNYRFRLRSLSRLAAQCGVANMKSVLLAVDKNEFDADGKDWIDEEEGDGF